MPNMKELLFPWNNWQSIASVNNYLTPDLEPDSERWPVTKNAHFSAGRFLGAEILEKKIEAAIQNAAKRKLTRFVTPGAGGAQAVQNAPTVLKPLFATTEINLRSARQQSGLHPLPQVNNTGPAQPVAIPATFSRDHRYLASKLASYRAACARGQCCRGWGRMGRCWINHEVTSRPTPRPSPASDPPPEMPGDPPQL
jgi:hypothetical protein